MGNVCQYAIKLIRFALNGDISELTNDIDFELLFEFSKSHGVENIVYTALRDLKIDVPETIMHRFKEAYEIAIMTEAVQTLELGEIVEAFERAGIKHVIMKGSVVKYLYPMPDYRKSGDIDILVHADDEPAVSSVMSDCGYKSDENFEEHDIHFAYRKPPFMLIEIHRQLVRESNRAFKFCSEVWENLHLRDGYKHLYCMNDEFHYVYLMAHLCKHLYSGGAGIRLITDIQVMKSKLNLDKNVLNKYLKKANLTDLHNIINGLIEKWFGDNYEQDQDVELLEKIIFESGSFGSMATKAIIRSNDEKSVKIKTFFRLLFPEAKTLKVKYPVLKKHSYLLPFVWIQRAFRILAHGSERINTTLKTGLGEGSYDISNIMAAIK